MSFNHSNNLNFDNSQDNQIVSFQSNDSNQESLFDDQIKQFSINHSLVSTQSDGSHVSNNSNGLNVESNSLNNKTDQNKKSVPFFNLPPIHVSNQIQNKFNSNLVPSMNSLETQMNHLNLKDSSLSNPNSKANSSNVYNNSCNINNTSDTNKNSILSPETNSQEEIISNIPKNSINNISPMHPFRMKKIYSNKSIILQNMNGPCPLIAILNALILREKSIPGINPELEFITLEGILSVLANFILSKYNTFDNFNSKSNLKNNSLDENLARMVDDVIALLPKLSQGLDINIRFDGGFEFTEALELFDLVEFKLFHCWCIDPDDTQWKFMRNLSFNSAMEKMIVGLDQENSQNSSSQTNNITSNGSLIQNEKSISESERIQIFFQEFGGQITSFGLQRLKSCMQDNQIAVLFWNSHFSTIIKRYENIYLIASDEGYELFPEIVYLRLDNVFGDFTTCGRNFKPLEKENFENQFNDLQYAMKLQSMEDSYISQKFNSQKTQHIQNNTHDTQSRQRSQVRENERINPQQEIKKKRKNEIDSQGEGNDCIIS